MEPDRINDEIKKLPPQAQKQVLDFIDFLKSRYRKKELRKASPKKSAISGEPFIGIWKDRQNMQDSSAWIRQIRKSEWGEIDA